MRSKKSLCLLWSLCRGPVRAIGTTGRDLPDLCAHARRWPARTRPAPVSIQRTSRPCDPQRTHRGPAKGSRDLSGLQLSATPSIAALNFAWTLQAGDFRVPTSMVDNVFQNIYFPEITARGFTAIAERPQWKIPPSRASKLSARVLDVASTCRSANRHRSLLQRKTDGPTQFELVYFTFAMTPSDARAFWRAIHADYLLHRSISLHLDTIPQALRRRLALRHLVRACRVGIRERHLDRAHQLRQPGDILPPLLGLLRRRPPWSAAPSFALRPTRWLDAFAAASPYRNNLERDARIPVSPQPLGFRRPRAPPPVTSCVERATLRPSLHQQRDRIP